MKTFINTEAIQDKSISYSKLADDVARSITAEITDSAPETLDTLNELAAALGDDPNFATTIITELNNKAEKSEIPIEKGDDANSVILKGEYNDRSNEAISRLSMAIGAATIAGLKGWYYSEINFSTKTITLSDVQPYLENGVLVAGSWNSDEPNISVDDEISIINNSIYDLKSKVTAVNGNIITVDNIPFNSYANVSIESQDAYDWAIYVPAKPDNGIIDLGFAAHAEGVITKATAPGAHSEGVETHAYGHYSHTEGRDTMAGYAAHAEGRRSIARGEQSHAQGLATIAEGNNSFTTGRDTKAYGDNSSALGYGSESHGENSLSSGITSKAKGVNSVALGNNVTAEGNNTFAEGNNTVNKGNSSHTEGLFSKVDVQDGELTDRFHRQNGYASHAEGYTSLAVGCGAHSEGMLTKAIGGGAHSEGYRTIASGGSSHVEGSYTEATNSSEHAQGKYNKSNTNTIHSVGIGTDENNRKNAHEITLDGKHYIIGIGGYDGTNPDTSHDLATYLNNMLHITYDDLVALRDNSQLIPGQQYRITDYVTTTIQENTRSAGHQFDIIVTADNESTLNEVARAIQHEGETYFSNSDLNAWKIWYCLDNDTERFAWADADNSKGVIYRMIDEWNNDCPYDFKNIQFARWVLSNPVGYIKNEEGNWIQESTPFDSLKNGFYGLDSSTNVFNYGKKYKVEYTISESPTYCYTFGKNTDYSISSETYKNYGNVIKEYYNSRSILQLNNIVFLNNSCDSNIFSNNCHSNTFNDTCSNNIFGNSCYSNSFGNGCYGNSFGSSCHSNSFGNYCLYNSLGNNCFSNILGNDCNRNSFGNHCVSNSFGNHCVSNSFGNDCDYNSFGNECSYNSFGNECNYNSFGDNCQSNNFGADCRENTFGNECNYNGFAVNCIGNSFAYKCWLNSFDVGCYGNIFDENCRNNSLGTECYENIFNSNCTNNNFKSYCASNEFGANCYGNIFDANCYNNIFGTECSNNDFGSGCYVNNFAANCANNSLGSGCYDNNFAANCANNSFGVDCMTNRLEASCKYNSFGVNCRDNRFGANCTSNSFGESCSNNSLGSYYQYNIIENGVSYCSLENDETASYTQQVQHYKITLGVSGTYNAMLIVNTERNRPYETTVALNSLGEIAEFCMTDIAQKANAIAIAIDE